MLPLMQSWHARRLGPLPRQKLPDASQPLPYATGPLAAPEAVPEAWRSIMMAAATAALGTAGRVRSP